MLCFAPSLTVIQTYLQDLIHIPLYPPAFDVRVSCFCFLFRDCHYIPRAAIYCFCYCWDWILSKQVGGAGAVTIDCIFVLMVVGGWVGIVVVAVGGVGGLMQRWWLCIFDGKTGH